MFTGIVEELGVVAAVEPLTDAARLTIACTRVLDDVTEGASIAVNGVCLTVTGWAGAPGMADAAGAPGTAGSDQVEPDTGGPGAGSAAPSRVFHADVMLETLTRSSLGTLAPGDPVNLERPVRLADRLGGHLVQGHVDGVGTVLARVAGEHWETVRISLPPELARYLVPKGSITVDGVSLTVVDVTDPGTGDVGTDDVGTGDAGTGDAGTSASQASFTVSLIPTTLRLTTLGSRAVGDQVNLEVDVLGKYVERLLRGGSPPISPPAAAPAAAAANPPDPAGTRPALTRSTTNGQWT
jgi:riboflavin synthase